MKTYFIVNPASGRGNGPELVAKAAASVPDSEIYITKGPKDATAFIRDICSSNPDTPMRFCACGGDGTLNEVVNGAAGFDNAEVTCFPCGSGNDFVKYYGGAEKFSDIPSLASCEAAPIDLLKVGDKYSINVVNFGFDTAVCKAMESARNKPIIGGKNAYNYGVFKAVLTAMKNKARIYADGELLNENGEFLLCTLGNGKYVGGKYCCAPRSVINDGYMELCMVKVVSRFTFIRLIGAYTKGQHLDDPRFSKVIVYRRCKKVDIKGPEGFCISLDGEVIDGTEFTCEVAPSALRFAAPSTSDEHEKTAATV